MFDRRGGVLQWGYAPNGDAEHIVLGQLLLSAVLMSIALSVPGPLKGQPVPDSSLVVIDGTIGYAPSKLVWNVGASGSSRDSQLAYRGLQVASASVRATARLWGNGTQQWLFRLRVEGGRIVGGSIRDSDGPPGRIGVLSISEATGKSLASVSAGMGWYRTLTELRPLEGLAFWLGADWSKRVIRMQNGEQILPKAVPGDILAGLDSRYRARWMGPWAAVEPALRIGSIKLTGRFGVHFLNGFRAHGRWNLRPELAQPLSFVQKSMGMGVEAGLRAEYSLCSTVTLTLNADRSRFTALWGKDTYYLSDGNRSGQELRSVGLTTSRLHLGILWAL